MAEKSVAQKLMIKEGRSVLLVNPPLGYDALLGELPAGVTLLTEPGEPVDIVQVFVANRRELEEQLPQLKPLVKSTGMIWVSYYKGTSKTKTDIHRDTIGAYARSLGMEGVAIISIDDDWSALRLKRV
jgi:predicted CoA-binding protein